MNTTNDVAIYRLCLDRVEQQYCLGDCRVTYASRNDGVYIRSYLFSSISPLFMLGYGYMNIRTIITAPITAMTKIYHTRYHLNYVHARKLFVFDVLLLSGTILLMAITVWWHTYDPTILNYIELNVTVTDPAGTPITRIASGEPVRYTIEYQNTSDAIMVRPKLQVTLPDFFQIESITAPNVAFDETQSSFSLPDIIPDASGTIHIDGVYYGTPDAYEDVLVALSYIQSGRTAVEIRHARIISSLRDAVLESTLTVPDTIRGTGSYPISITLTNTGSRPLTDISLPTSTVYGTIVWDAETRELAANDVRTITGRFTPSISPNTNAITLTITPSLIIQDTVVPQDTVTAALRVIHPQVTLSDVGSAASTLGPGDRTTITITIQNTGDSRLTDVTVALPLPAAVIDAAATAAANPTARLTGQTLSIPAAEVIEAGQILSFTIPVVVRSRPSGGTDIAVSFTPQVSAQAAGGDTLITDTKTTAPIRIGTTVELSAQSIYYTREGDQLGRGPLPPQVNTETKYWVLLTLENSSSHIDDIDMRATLPPHVTWTGRTSVSLGNDLVYTPATRLVTWRWNTIAPGQTLGMYMELAVTPPTSMVGEIPMLLTDISVRATDRYINTPISRSIANVRANLIGDPRGQALGVTVQQ